MRKDIRVSFVDNEEEDKLYDDILEECKYIGKAKWMKIAAREKLERNHDNKPQKINNDITTNSQGGIIDSMDQFFK